VTALYLSRALYGALLTVRPGLVAATVDRDPNRAARAFIRILGIRQLAEAVVVGRRPSPSLLAAGAGVDLIHAATVLVLARRAPAHRRALYLNAAGATGLGSWALAVRRRARRAGA
jgi:hypothetical protein